MKELFKIRKTIISLSDDHIDTKPLLGLIVVAILAVIPSVLGFGGYFVEFIKETFIPLQDTQGSEKLAAFFEILAGLVALSFVCVVVTVILISIVSWIVRNILSLFKKNISFYKLFNIFIYSLLVSCFFRLIFITLFALTYLVLKSITENQAEAIVFLLIILINLLGFSLYIYGIKISTRNDSDLSI